MTLIANSNLGLFVSLPTYNNLKIIFFFESPIIVLLILIELLKELILFALIKSLIAFFFF